MGDGVVLSAFSMGANNTVNCGLAWKRRRSAQKLFHEKERATEDGSRRRGYFSVSYEEFPVAGHGI